MLKTQNKVHVFELANLGKAPFKYVGMTVKRGPIDIGNGIMSGAPGQPMGSCDYCGTGIALCFQIKSQDGKSFVVGSSCVDKTGDRGLKRQVNKVKAAAQYDREVARIKVALAWFNENKAQFEALPHPSTYYADQGKTLADYNGFILAYGGHSSRLGLCRKFKKLGYIN